LTAVSLAPPSDPAYDIEFFWDPVCPFAWITSRWVEKVAKQTGYSVDWRFISLRLLNRDKDYAVDFPPEYEQAHTAGLRLLRVAAAVRDDLGRQPLGALVTAIGVGYWDEPQGSRPLELLGTPRHTHEVLEIAGLSTDYAAALDDESWDPMLDAETDMCLERTGHDVGTPIITFRGEPEVSFFGPVISRVPDEAEAVALWEAVTTLAAFPGFAEMKRSLREVPQLNVLGGISDVPLQEDWKAGHRAGHAPGDN